MHCSTDLMSIWQTPETMPRWRPFLDRSQKMSSCTFFTLMRGTFHNIYKLQKHVLLRHQSYPIVLWVAKIYDFGK